MYFVKIAIILLLVGRFEIHLDILRQTNVQSPPNITSTSYDLDCYVQIIGFFLLK